MKFTKSVLLVLFFFSVSGCVTDLTDWENLSISLNQWNQTGDANWRMEDNAFVADEGAGLLVTKDSYRDLHIQLEFWVDMPANSGVFLRAQDPDDIRDVNSYEVNIFDTRPDQTYRTGGVVHFAPPSEVIHTAGRWNTYDIRMKGERLQVRLNGVKTVDIEDDTYSEGPIGLQYGAGVVKFRDIRIREL